MHELLTDTLAALAPIGLADVAMDAALLTRVDRKYLVDPALLAKVASTVHGEVRGLDIDGERAFEYRSTYFDTPDLHSYRDAARRRPHRFKVRTRAYLSTGSCWLEVKLHDRRGHTVKERIDHDAADEAVLTPTALDFLGRFDDISDHAGALRPVLITTYRRSTLVCEQRVTIDLGLAFARPDGAAIRHAGDLGHLAVLETKSATRQPGPFDRALWACGVRPVTMSKYCVGMAADDPALPANKWHRLMARHVHGGEPAGAFAG